MSKCRCMDELPCPIHKDKPLELPEAEESLCIVIRVYRLSKHNKGWYSTVAKNAIQTFVSEIYDTRQEAIDAATTIPFRSLKGNG